VAHPSFCTMSIGDPFPIGKARPGRDADHSPPSTAEVANDYTVEFRIREVRPVHNEGPNNLCVSENNI
jgi:hypothetical protein